MNASISVVHPTPLVKTLLVHTNVCAEMVSVETVSTVLVSFARLTYVDDNISSINFLNYIVRMSLVNMNFTGIEYDLFSIQWRNY